MLPAFLNLLAALLVLAASVQLVRRASQPVVGKKQPGVQTRLIKTKNP